MPCSSCGAQYGVFKKEVGCESCGFSFCPKCCRKQDLPSENGDMKRALICNQCFSIKIKGKSSTTADISPPLAHKKRMSALKKQSMSVDSVGHMQLQSEWCDKDQELAERLQKLKNDRIKVQLPSESEIEERIAKLKGMDPSLYKAPPIEVFRPADRRSSTEKATDLMKEVTERVALDSKIVKPEDEIEARLARLRAMDTETTNEEISSAESKNIPPEALISQNSEPLEKLTEEEQIKRLLGKYQVPQSSHEDIEMTEEDEADRLLEKLMASNVDDDKLDSLQEEDSEKSLPSDEQNTLEEFPWCVICSQDAKIRCFGCDEDLYCLRCFKECHDSLDIKDHKTCPFLPPKEPTI